MSINGVVMILVVEHFKMCRDINIIVLLVTNVMFSNEPRENDKRNEISTSHFLILVLLTLPEIRRSVRKA